LVTNNNFITIAPNTSQEFFVEIPTQLSDNFILSQLVTDDIKLRIQFLKNVSQPVVAGNYVPTCSRYKYLFSSCKYISTFY